MNLSFNGKDSICISLFVVREIFDQEKDTQIDFELIVCWLADDGNLQQPVSQSACGL
jgi:hypothetical protein